jgi:DNA-binding response OmpR family regulator
MHRLRIVVAEDEAMIAIYLAETLVEMGHEVCSIEATQSGLVAAAARFDPDLMIVDARLGAGSGVLAVEEILKRRFVPHVFASGDRPTLRRLGEGAVVIEKPYHEADLAMAIERAVAAAPVAPSAE